ncbi:MAG: DUF3576 domain-containing protein [Pseudomonadota bacterium]
MVKILGIAGAAAVLAACAGGGSKISDRDAPLAAGTDAKGSPITSVNRYLWRASLDTIEFMPMDNADPVAGVITTEWYANPESPGERFKANVYILDTALRADALRVSVFRQQFTEAGWLDAQVNPATGREIENAILTRARQLRLNSLGD